MNNNDTDNVFKDPILAETHAFREARAKRFNYDPDAMF